MKTRKFLALLLSLVMAIGLMTPAAMAEGETGDESTPAIVVTFTDGHTMEFDSLAAAMRIGYSGGEQEKITVYEDITEEMGYLEGNIVSGNPEGVTITNTIVDEWIYCDDTNFTLGEGVTYKAEGYASGLFVYGDDCVINGTMIVDCYYQRYADSKLTINAPGSLTVNTETFILRYTDGDGEAGIYINGDDKDDTIELKLAVAYFYQGMISAEDATIKVGTYWQTNTTDGQGSANLVLDNSKMTVTVNEHNFKATGNSTVTLKNGSILDVAKDIEMDEDGTLSMDATSLIKKGGKVAYEAVIGTTPYATLAEAIKDAEDGGTITLLSDVELADTLTIAKSITLDGNDFALIPADSNKTYNSAIMVGDSGWGDDHGETIKIKDLDLSDWNTNYGVVRVQGVTIEMDGCTLSNNTVSNVAYGVLSLNFADATVKNSAFDRNKSRAIDINYNGDASNAVVIIDNCVFTNNESSGAGIVVRNDGEKLIVTNSEFSGNTVSTNGNAATLYAGWGEADVVTGNLFEDNTVITSHATTKRFASAIFCDGCEVTGNAFVGNTATRNGEDISTTVAVAAYYGPADVSGNYWDGGEPSYTVEYTNNEVANTSYYTTYTNGTLGGLAKSLIFNANGGSFTDTSDSEISGFFASLPSVYRSSYTFNGWCLEDGTKVTSISQVADGATLYAQWTKKDTSSSKPSDTTTSTEKNDDGSTTTTTTNKTTGTVTETTKNTDGSSTVVETQKDGTVTTTEKTAEGVTSTVVEDKRGNVTEITAEVPAAAAKEAAENNEPVTLPVEVEAPKDSGDAVEISVNVPSKGATVEIPVEDVTPGTVVVIVDSEGNETIVPTTTLTEDGVVVTLDEDATIKVIDNSKDFEDVADDYALADSIDFVSARGLFEGTSETTYNPHAETTIAQTMTVLARLSGEDFYGAGATAKGAEWAEEKGLHDGTPVHQAITRQQMVLMMWKLAGCPMSDHEIDHHTDDHHIDDHALEAMQWAVEHGILTGYEDGSLKPHAPASRAHVAAFTERYVNIIA